MSRLAQQGSLKRWAVVLVQAGLFGFLALGLFVLNERYGEYLPTAFQVNLFVGLAALAVLFVLIRKPEWAELKSLAVFGLCAGSLVALVDWLVLGVDVRQALLLAGPSRSALVMGVVYACLMFSVVQGVRLLFVAQGNRR